MRRLPLTSILSFLTLCSFAQKPVDYNEVAIASYKKAEKELASVYHKILIEYKQDSIFIKNIRAVQSIWLKLRDAEMKAMYPAYPVWDYGTNHTVCWFDYKEQLTRERIKKLRIWLTDVDESNICSGSVKIKH